MPRAGQTKSAVTPRLPDRIAIGVRQEVWAHLLVHYAIRTLMHQAALDAEVDPDRLSFTRSLHIARRQVTGQAAFSPSAAGQGDPAGGH
jgi:hypothetical protein